MQTRFMFTSHWMEKKQQQQSTLNNFVDKTTTNKTFTIVKTYIRKVKYKYYMQIESKSLWNNGHEYTFNNYICACGLNTNNEQNNNNNNKQKIVRHKTLETRNRMKYEKQQKQPQKNSVKTHTAHGKWTEM